MRRTVFLGFFFRPFRAEEHFPASNCWTLEGTAPSTPPGTSICGAGQRRATGPDDLHELLLPDLWGIYATGVEGSRRPREGKPQRNRTRRCVVSLQPLRRPR